MTLLALAPLIVTQPRAVATDESADALFIARAALKRAITMRELAILQVDQLRALVARLESQRR